MNDAPVLPDEDDEVGEILLNDWDDNGVDENYDDAESDDDGALPDEDDEVGEKHFCQVESEENCKDGHGLIVIMLLTPMNVHWSGCFANADGQHSVSFVAQIMRRGKIMMREMIRITIMMRKITMRKIMMRNIMRITMMLTLIKIHWSGCSANAYGQPSMSLVWHLCHLVGSLL